MTHSHEGLHVKDLHIEFGGITALKNLDFHMEQGEILAIIGPNGAGKTTVFNLISRFYEPTGGAIAFNGINLLEKPAHEMARCGVSRTFQNIELFDRSTVLDNLITAQYSLSKTNLLAEIFFTRRARRQEIDFRKNAEDIIDFLELSHFRYETVGSLPYGARKMVEIARALTYKPELLLLDEPSSGLNQEETDDLSHWIDDIRSELGVTILLIEHNMTLVGQVADRVIVLVEGEKIAEGQLEEIRKDERVISSYLGTDG